MRTRAAALVAVLLFAAGTAGCTKPGADSNANQGTGSLGDATTPTTPPTADGSGGPTEAAAEPTYPNDIVAYAKAAVTAWASKDEARLDQLEAPGGVLHTMLVTCFDCYDVSFYLSTCPQTGPYVTCTFFNAVGDELRLRGDPSLIGKPHAIPAAGSVFDQVTFPSDNKAYAGLAMTAWLNRNDNRLKLLTKDSLTSAQVDALGGNRNAAWNYDHNEGAAGSVYYVWKDPSGHTMSVRFVNGPAAPTTGPNAQHRIVQFIYMP